MASNDAPPIRAEPQKHCIDGIWVTEAELTRLFLGELVVESHLRVRQIEPFEVEPYARRRVPNESDFCAGCGTLTMGARCSECPRPTKAAVIQPKPPPRIAPVKPTSEGLEL